MVNNNATKKIREITQQGKAGDRDTPTPPKSSAELLYRLSSGRSVTVQEARALSERGDFRSTDERKC